MNEHSEDILSVPWRGSTIGLAGCGIWLFFLVILGMRAENRSGMWAFNNHRDARIVREKWRDAGI